MKEEKRSEWGWCIRIQWPILLFYCLCRRHLLASSNTKMFQNQLCFYPIYSYNHTLLFRITLQGNGMVHFFYNTVRVVSMTVRLWLCEGLSSQRICLCLLWYIWIIYNNWVIINCYTNVWFGKFLEHLKLLAWPHIY